MGSSADEGELDILERKARIEIDRIQGQAGLFPNNVDNTVLAALGTVSNSQVEMVGPHNLLGRVYDAMGYGEIGLESLFRDLVIARLAYPGSKLKTVEYLSRHRNMDISVYTIYRFMDKIQDGIKDSVERATFGHFRRILGGSVGIVFYDMTTLYFETPDEDDLRKIGYSKDGKHQHPQIKLGLLVGPEGYPLGYDVFEGNIYEGHTLIPVLERIASRFSIGKPIVIADAGLLSDANINALIEHGYKFVLGGKIRNESSEVKDAVQRLEISENEPREVAKHKYRLIVSFSAKRMRKDAHNRKKGLARLEKKVRNGKLDKTSINNRGYNKYLTFDSEVKVTIDYKKFEADGKWDGLKGYLTNTDMSPKEVIAAYGNLWQIEKAFRISKTDIRIRPVYHRIPRRIQAHICICFASYAVFKELERLLKANDANFSVYRAIELTKSMYQITVFLPDTKTYASIPLRPTAEQQDLINAVMKN